MDEGETGPGKVVPKSVFVHFLVEREKPSFGLSIQNEDQSLEIFNAEHFLIINLFRKRGENPPAVCGSRLLEDGGACDVADHLKSDNGVQTGCIVDVKASRVYRLHEALQRLSCSRWWGHSETKLHRAEHDLFCVRVL